MQNFMECFLSRNHSYTQNWLNSKQCELRGISANKIIRMYVGDFSVLFSLPSTVYSLLTDTSIKRTPRVGPCLSLLPLFDSL